MNSTQVIVPEVNGVTNRLVRFGPCTGRCLVKDIGNGGVEPFGNHFGRQLPVKAQVLGDRVGLRKSMQSGHRNMTQKVCQGKDLQGWFSSWVATHKANQNAKYFQFPLGSNHGITAICRH